MSRPEYTTRDYCVDVIVLVKATCVAIAFRFRWSMAEDYLQL